MNNSFWSKLGPIVFSVFSTVALALGSWSAKSLVTLQRDLAVHETIVAHGWAYTRHELTDTRLDELEKFQARGERFTLQRGTRMAQLLEELAAACSEKDEKTRNRMMNVALKHIAEYKIELTRSK